MIRTLARSWWLLAICGILDAVYSAMNFSHVRTLMHYRSTLVVMGVLALAAGVCTMAASIWNFGKTKSWLLAVNGLACSALGLIFISWTHALSFRTVALFIALMALSIGAYELAGARTWLAGLAGVVSLSFGLVFLAFTFRWIRLNPASRSESLLLLGCYFAFAAVCMLGLSMRNTNRTTYPLVL